MGLDATVMCNCYRDGRTSEPPVPRDWLEIDAEGYLNLKTEHDSDERFIEVHHWMETCCAHPGMRAAWERISNWSGYRLFQEAIGKIGWDRFPVLERELPRANGGLTASSASVAALGEIELFRRSGDVGEAVGLFDTSSGEMLQTAVAAYDGVFIMSGKSGLIAGIDPLGFFIRRHDTGVELFRAMRFTQTLLAPESYMPGPEAGRVVFQSLETDRRFECRIAVDGRQIPWPDGRMEDDRGRCRFDHPTQLHVDRRPERSSDYEYILKPLEIVFRASAETGNPVRWC